jgi:general secretion pathway protein J
MKRAQNGRRSRGFTLVEVLVALAILAVLGVLAWRGIEGLVHARARIDADTRDTERVVRTLAQMRVDLDRRVPDVLFGGGEMQGDRLPVAIELAIDAKGRTGLAVLRSRADLPGFERVTYVVDGDVLARVATPTTTGGEADRVRLVDGVRGFGLRVLLAAGWTDLRAYLDAGLAGGRVAALEMTIERSGGERYVQVVEL